MNIDADTADASFSADAFLHRARARLAAAPVDIGAISDTALLRGDHRINPGLEPSAEKIASLRSAAVLIPIIARRGEATVLLTQRTDHLPAHAGQVAFPGGKIEGETETPLEAALRETEEEIGLSRAHVEPIGYLKPYHTTSGFCIVPVVATVQPGFSVVPDASEVADVFEVPLSFLMNPANHLRQSREWNGIVRHFFVMPYRDRHIWGVTAGIIRELYDEVYR